MVAVATVEKITRQITGKDKIEVPVVEVPVVGVEEAEVVEEEEEEEFVPTDELPPLPLHCLSPKLARVIDQVAQAFCVDHWMPFAGALRAAGSAAQIVTLSNNASGGFIKSLGANARGVIVTQVYPNERAVTYPMVKEAQELAKAKGLNEITPAMLEGYAAAKVLVEGLKRRPQADSRKDPCCAGDFPQV